MSPNREYRTYFLLAGTVMLTFIVCYVVFHCYLGEHLGKLTPETIVGGIRGWQRVMFIQNVQQGHASLRFSATKQWLFTAYEKHHNTKEYIDKIESKEII